MKKYFLSIVALAAMLFATSCQESLVEPQMDGTTTFTVQLPDQMGTKAIGEASSVNKLFVEVYSDGTSIFKKTQDINGSTTVSLDLIKGQEYQIVFWAQKDNSYITDFTTQGLAEISIPNTFHFHNNESGAAFYAYETFEIDGNPKTVELRRPFAQLNLGTTEASLKTNAGNVTLESSSVTLTTATKFSTIYGAGTDVQSRTYAANISFGDEKLTLANGDEYVYVSMDYLPVVYGGDVVELGVVIETNLGTITHNITNVPIQKNYRTNIVGNLISSTTDFKVEVNDNWAGPDNNIVKKEVSTAADLVAAIENSEVGEVVLINDIELSQTLTFSVPQSSAIARASESAQRRDFIFDGNGKTLTYTGSDRAIDVSLEGFNLTLKNLTLKLGSTYAQRGVNYNTNGKLVLENVTIADKEKCFTYAINLPGNSDNAEVEIKNSKLYGNIALNVWGEKLIVNADNSHFISVDKVAAENYCAISLNNDGTGTNIAEGAVVTINGGSITALDENGELSDAVRNATSTGAVVISNTTKVTGKMSSPVANVMYSGYSEFYSCTTLQDAINKAIETNAASVVLIKDVEIAEPLEIEDGSFVLDLNGKTINVGYKEESQTNHIYAFENHANLTIKGNGTINARGIFNYGVLTLENGTINAIDGNGGYAVRNYEDSEFIMNGGTVATTYEDGDVPGQGYDATPIRVDAGAKAVINDGNVTNISNFTVAIDNYGETTINGGTITSVHTTVANEENDAIMTINGGSFTCNGIEGVTAHVLWAAGGTVNINGGSFDGKDNYNGFNVDAAKGSVVNICGGKFLPVHSGSLYGEGKIAVSGGTFFDNPSARLADGYDAVFDNDNKVWTVVSKAN